MIPACCHTRCAMAGTLLTHTFLGLLLFCSNVYGVIAAEEGVGCRFPGAPAHSNVVFSDETLGPGTVATYTCERGFELLGPARRVCEPDGRWLPDGIPFCVLNVAAGKAPMQASTESGGIPQRAIDGSTSSFFSADTCTLTRPERTPWWYVNLLEPYMVQLVRLDFGKSCCDVSSTIAGDIFSVRILTPALKMSPAMVNETLANLYASNLAWPVSGSLTLCVGKPATVVVRVGNNRPDLGTNPVCNRFTGFLEEGAPLFLPCNPPMPGAFVSVHLEVTAPTQLSICEAFVYTDQALPIERCPQFRDQPPGSTATYNGKCYVFYGRQPLRFREALAFCRARGGTLVDESNPALQGFISWELWRRHRSDSSGQYWMGAVRDPREPTNWKWLGGDDVTVSFWNEPEGITGHDKDCARYDGSKGWLWSATDCGMQLNYICQHRPEACGRPEQPPNSTMRTRGTFEVGGAVEYECDAGHLLVGPPTRTCLDTGFYDEFPPVCKHIQCGYPADIANGGYQLSNGTVGYLSHVVYRCDEGYEMIGRAQLTCDIDERWNGPPPRCEAIECEEPSILANGFFTTSTNGTIFGTIVRYTCDRGFRLIGPRELSCQPNGQYDNQPPVCQAEDTTVTLPTTTISVKTTKVASTIPRVRTRPGPTTVRALTEADILNRLRTNRTRARPARPGHGVDNSDSESSHIPHIVVASHPQENEVGGGNVNVRHGESPNVNVPLPVDGERRETFGAKLNLGAVIALGAFGGFVFLAAVITTIVILVRRNQSAKHYRHRASPDCNTVASFDSSSSESRNGLNRYYRQAWENLHESAGGKAAAAAAAAAAGPKTPNGGGHSPLRRKDTLDEPYRNGERHRDGSEMVVSDTAAYKGNGQPGANGGGERKRHHHHHHHHEARAHRGEWREPRHNHKRY